MEQMFQSTVCKALCTAPQFSGSTSAFLNSIVEFCIAETGKPKTTQANMEILELALKIVANCCDCVEGRVLIIKVNAGAFFSRHSTANRMITKTEFDIPGTNAAHFDPAASASHPQSKTMAKNHRILAVSL